MYRDFRRIPEPTSRLLTVPKDSRGPRIICCEPVELMYIQQGVARDLMYYIEHHDYTKGHVNFVDQTINNRLVLEASASLEWATIDLSDASDRVGVALVQYLFPEWVSRKWLALRSTATELPDGTVVPLRKFAAMGSALCFPVESLVFWALAVGCIWECTSDLSFALDCVYVYGDDIIVKDEYALRVMNTLESAGLKVNRDKSFIGSVPFRESCGVDGLLGHDVTPLRIRNLPPQRPSDGSAIASWLRYASNAVSIAPKRSLVIEKTVARLIGRIPRTPVEQPFLSIVDPLNFWSLEDFKGAQWYPQHQLYRFEANTLKQRKRRSYFEVWARLQHDITVGAGEEDPSVVVDRSSTQIRKRMCEITYLPYGGDRSG